jgi:NTP pyrophosphatase (non-canonical NTP hydrolase)
MDRYRQLKLEFGDWEEQKKNKIKSRSTLRELIEQARKAYGDKITPEIEQWLDQVSMEAGHLEFPLESSKKEISNKGSAVSKFFGILLEALELFQRKNKQYGNAIVYTGVRGAVVALTGDVARLRVLLKEEQLDRENLRDKLIDVLVQAAIGILMLDEDNMEGKEIGDE